MKNQKGFTLIELLTVMSIMIVVGIVITAILASILRGTNKTTTVSAVKQNGDYAISQMSKMIRNAASLDSGCSSQPTPTPMSSITITTVDGTQAVFDCNGTVGTPPQQTIASNSASLLDTSAVSLVSNSCSFLCTQRSASDAPFIQINFSLTSASTSQLVEQKVNAIPFQTSVIVRNQNR